MILLLFEKIELTKNNEICTGTSGILARHKGKDAVLAFSYQSLAELFATLQGLQVLELFSFILKMND